MLNVILGILMVSLVSASGFMLIEQMSLTAAVADQRENARRLDMAADAVAAKLGTPHDANQGTIYAPAAVAGSGAFAYGQLPDMVAGVHTTVSGVPFRYCPYAPLAGAYQVSDNYVVRGDTPADPALAKFQPAGIIIAAGLKGALPPSCDAVKVVDGRVTVPGGLARMISGIKGVSDAQLTDGNSFEMWVAPNGNGNGVDAMHPTSMVAAMTVWKGKLPKSMVIHVPGNAIFSDDGGVLSDAFNMPSEPAGTVRSSKLSIVSPGGAIIPANATFDPQGSLALVGVNMPETVIRLASHNQASLRGVRVAAVDVRPGSAVAFNGGVSVQGGGVNVAGDATVQGSLEVVAWPSSGQIDLIAVPSGGRLVLSGAGIVVRGITAGSFTSGIAVAGDLAGNGNVLSAGSGVREIVRLVDGGRMAMNGTLTGVVYGRTVLSDGMPASVGGNVLLGQGALGCWGGDAFASSTGPTSQPVVPEQMAPPTPGADPAVNEQQNKDFIANSDARAKATSLLGINRSTWACGA